MFLLCRLFSFALLKKLNYFFCFQFRKRIHFHPYLNICLWICLSHRPLLIFLFPQLSIVRMNKNLSWPKIPRILTVVTLSMSKWRHCRRNTYFDEKWPTFSKSTFRSKVIPLNDLYKLCDTEFNVLRKINVIKKFFYVLKIETPSVRWINFKVRLRQLMFKITSFHVILSQITSFG